MWNAFMMDRVLPHADEEAFDFSDTLDQLVRQFEKNRRKCNAGQIDIPASLDADDFLEIMVDQADRSEVVNGLACKVLVAQVGAVTWSFETNPATRQISWKQERDFTQATERARKVSLYEKFLLIEYDILMVAEQNRDDIPALLEMMDTTRQHLVGMGN